MALGEPLLSIIRNAAEWLADSKDNVTLLLSPTINVFNGDTECSYYFALMLQMTFSVLLSYREIPSIKMQNTQSDVGVFTAIWIGWGLS
jgi:hypothetical protein